MKGCTPRCHSCGKPEGRLKHYSWCTTLDGPEPAREWSHADPEYYREPGGKFDIIDVIAAYKLDFDLGCVAKYIFRAGRKPGADFLTDLRKAKRVLERRIEREEGATTNRG